MTVDNKKIIVGIPDRVTGAVMNAPLGTALPTTVSGSVSAFTDCGYITDAGIVTSHSLNTVTTHDWGGDIVRQFVQTADGKITLTFLESNAQSAAAFWGSANVTTVAPTGGTGNVTNVLVNGLDPNHFAWVFNIKDGVRKKRIAVPDGQVLSRGPITYSRGAAATYQVDITTFPDSSGNVWYEYTDDGEVTGGSSSPVITSVTPSGRGATQLVNINGVGFTGATAVTFNAIAATAFTVENDGLIVAELPTGSAGSAPVIVTTPIGASASFPYTRAT